MSRIKHLTRNASFTIVSAALVLASPSPSFASEAAEPFTAPRDRASMERALQCLTQAIYYEARSESDDGQRAVAQVVLNRVRHPSYPNSVCGVVFQGSERRTGCQFSFTCDGSMGPYIDARAWARAERIAEAALHGSVYKPVGLALNYHTTAIRPYWAPSLIRQAVIGAHIFYRKPGYATNASFRQDPAAFEPRAGYTHAVARTNRAESTRGSGGYQAARLERAVVERPRVERATIERPRVERPRVERAVFQPPVSSRVAGARRTSASVIQQQAQPAPSRGPRTTIERGVRVARGS